MDNTDQLHKLKLFLTGYTRLVIVGLGNPLRGDDGVGLLVHDQLKERLSGCEDISFIRAETVLENFIGPIQKLQPSHILLLDAVVSVEHEAGEWLLLEPEDMESSFDSTHTLPFSLFAGMMGESPAIKGIGFVVETVTFGESMTPPASQAGLDLVTLLEHLLVGVSSDLLSRRPVCLAP